MILTLATVAGSLACSGGGEQRVVNQYFGAVNAQDNQTLTSFSLANFNKKVERWKITGTSPESRRPATLADLVQKVKDLEAQLAQNKKDAGAFSLQHVDEYNRYREATSKGKVPPALAKFGEEWEKFNTKDRELKRAITEAKAAVERERRAVTLSVGNVAEIDNLTGEAVDKQIDLDLTIAGEVKPYQMTLRKYDLSNNKDKVKSRWLVLNLSPKA
jgi:hypothetical protein